MSAQVLIPDVLVLPEGIRSNLAVRVAQGRVEEIAAPETWPGDPRVHLSGTLMPGAIDLQVNGAGGRSVDEASSEALDVVARVVLEGGATSFLPTLISAPFDDLLDQVRGVASWIKEWSGAGARPLGIHVEGPFLAVPGAHPPGSLVDPTPERVEALLSAAGGHLALVTLAPEREGAIDATRRLTAAGTRVSIGHAADPGQVAACVDAGANLATHLFNVMSPIHHRDSSVALAVMDDPRLTCGLIGDGHHVSPAAMRLAWSRLGRGRLALVTDCASPAGAGDGEFDLGSVRVHAERGVVRDGAGRLAGSAALMRDVVRGFGEAVPGLDGSDWAHLCSVTPAAAIGLKAGIEVGSSARFSLLGPDGALLAVTG